MISKKTIIGITLAGLINPMSALANNHDDNKTTSAPISGAILTGSVILSDVLEVSPDRHLWEIKKVKEYVSESNGKTDKARKISEEINNVIGEKAVRQKVYFKTNEYQLTQKDANYLSNLVQGIDNHHQIKVTLEGHADIRGDDIYNKQLAKKRINGIRDALVSAGVKPERIKIVNIANDNKKEKNDINHYFFDRVVNIYFYQ